MYTIKPKERYAKAFGRDLRISTKAAVKICRVIRNKPLSRAKRLLNDLIARRRNLKGKYYTKTVKDIADLLSSCEKNAEFFGLDNEKLFVHASAHTGTIMRRRRRKSAFGSRLKSTNLEIMLIEKGKREKTEIEKKEKIGKEKKAEKPEIKKEVSEEEKKETTLVKKEIRKEKLVKEENKESEEKIEKEKEEIKKEIIREEKEVSTPMKREKSEKEVLSVTEEK